MDFRCAYRLEEALEMDNYGVGMEAKGGGDWVIMVFARKFDFSLVKQKFRS